MHNQNDHSQNKVLILKVEFFRYRIEKGIIYAIIKFFKYVK